MIDAPAATSDSASIRRICWRHTARSGGMTKLVSGVRTDMDSGHQGSADLKSESAEKALFWAFAGRCLG